MRRVIPWLAAVLLAPALGCETCQVFTGHPLLPDTSLERELPRAA